MKGSVILAAAAAAGASAAAHRGHAQAHAVFKRYAEADVCVPGCKTIYTTFYGEPTLIPNPPKSSSAPPAPPIVTPITTEAPKPTSTFTPPGDVPTPVPELCPTPGEYTFPATTITVEKTTTVCAPETTKLPPGPNTYGGITTIVETATTIVCPYPTAKTEDGVVTSVIETTTFVCPTPGTYTIAPTTTDCAEETTVVYPTITTITPGTYTRPAVTTTITETSVIVVCPWTSKAPEPTPEPQPETPVYEEPAPAPETSAPAPAPETPVYDVPTIKETSVADTPKSSDVTLGGSKGDHWAITYTPFSEDASGSCKSAEQVDADIQTIKNSGFTTVRVYSTDCSTLEHVGPACEKYGLKMIIGIFVKDTCDPNSAHIREQVDAITAWKQWDMVELIVVGNEALFQNRCDVAGLRTLISSVKSSCNGAGYTGPYTTAETLNVWERSDVSSALCGVVDIVGGQIHPYFNADVAPSDAGKFVKGQLDILDSICAGKSSLNLECGWPTGGNANGKAVPGKSQQATAIQSIREVAGDKTVFFSFHNDEWKEPGACGCERTWGCGQLF